MLSLTVVDVLVFYSSLFYFLAVFFLAVLIASSLGFSQFQTIKINSLLVFLALVAFK